MLPKSEPACAKCSQSHCALVPPATLLCCLHLPPCHLSPRSSCVVLHLGQRPGWVWQSRHKQATQRATRATRPLESLPNLLRREPVPLAAELALHLDVLVLLHDVVHLRARQQAERPHHPLLGARAEGGEGLEGPGREELRPESVEKELEHLPRSEPVAHHRGGRAMRDGVEVRGQLLESRLVGKRQQLHVPAARRLDLGAAKLRAVEVGAFVDASHEHAGGERALALLGVEQVPVDVLRNLARLDLRDRGVGRRHVLAWQVLCAHHLQRALADAGAHVELALRVGRQCHRRVAHVASRLQLAVGGGHHAAQRPIALKVDLESLVLLQPLCHQQGAR
mmetsp:Transcript_18503/g.31521  ORF Transcript_18503/g.31521 Transcript_18503/m.31521 type:complete len:337 (+) Transcript_18503:168-1178(+)